MIVDQTTRPVNLSRAAEMLSYLADANALSVIQIIQTDGSIDRDKYHLTPFQVLTLVNLDKQGLLMLDGSKYVIHPLIAPEALTVIDALFPPTWARASGQQEN